ncbi:hypothetical protein L1887_12892 [Cichorium endivia]|nr:hypothetical protein L1887_12892 [Cichorium endivia]
MTPHKLAPRSTACLYLGPSSDHRGYRCLDLITQRVIISRHIIFDESHFPYRDFHPPPDNSDYSPFAPDVELGPLPSDPVQTVASDSPPSAAPPSTAAPSSSPVVPPSAPSAPFSPPLTSYGHPISHRFSQTEASIQPFGHL